nr:zinc finger, CCHC-type, retrotransposon Gag domain protein [Tanacetum cinerariifolium]
MCFPDFPACFQTFKTLCLRNYDLMIRHDYDITSSLRRGALQLWYQSQTLLPQIHAEIREEFRTSSGPFDAGGNPPPVTIHTWLECFNKQKPHSFEKATAPVDAKNWISHMEKIFDVMGSAGTEEEQAKNFQWGLRRSTLNHLMCMSYTDVAQVANAARNYKILYERDDDDTERPDERQKSGDLHQPTSQQSSHRNHGHNNDRHGSDRRGGSDNHRSSNNNSSGSNNRNSGYGRDQRNRGQQSNRSAISGSQQSRGLSKGYSYQFALLVDADTQESVVKLLKAVGMVPTVKLLEKAQDGKLATFTLS